ncbi:MAG: segregation/condensation protein A [Acidimicrobiia bacterium]|nr:segregation/condensation protein A [Acidimicrobiia bacterium]
MTVPEHASLPAEVEVTTTPTGCAGPRVRVEDFDGPIDLLLELIRARKMEITAVSVAAIVDDYLTTVNSVTQLDLDAASRFLLVAATLLHLKTQWLLPLGEMPEIDEDLLADAERDTLLWRLIGARTFAEVAEVLCESLEDGTRYVPRAVQPEEAVSNVVPDLLRQVTITDLARLAAAALNREDETVPVMAHVEPIKVSLRATIVELAAILPRVRTASYRALCRHKTMLEAVVHFLAVLELLMAGVVRVEQDSPTDDIVLTWIGEDGWAPSSDVAGRLGEIPAGAGPSPTGPDSAATVSVGRGVL